MENRRRTTIGVGLLAGCYVAVLPMANTIALRNIVLAMLLLMTIWRLRDTWRASCWTMPVLAWIAYLCVFPLVAQNHEVAWQSFWGQWARWGLAALVGAFVATYLNKAQNIFALGVASAVPLLVHLALFAFEAWRTKALPWGYWGRETHHADLGYAAGQAILLLSVMVVTGSNRLRLWSIALISLSLLSVLFAMSRAGLLFGLFAGALVLGGAYLTSGRLNHRRMVFALLGAFIVVGVVLGVAIKTDKRWHDLITQLPVAWSGDALEVECRGDQAIGQAADGPAGAGSQPPQLAQPVHVGDGSRILILRAGFELALKNPWGLDGSRQAYQKRLLEICPEPVHLMAHTHNGWLDTVLALGWIGAALYLWVLIYFLRQGATSLRSQGSLDPWAMVLMATSVFWILRGFTDSVFRDHMLEMQGFLLAYAATVRKIRHQD